jgi:hypothetical protein
VDYIGFIQINKLDEIKSERPVSFDLGGRTGGEKLRLSVGGQGYTNPKAQRNMSGDWRRERRNVRLAPVDGTALDGTALDNTAALGATHSTDGVPAGGTSKSAARRKH